VSDPQQLSDGVVRLGTPWVNWYLVADDSGVTVVDSGVPGYRDQLEPGLELLGRSLDDVRAVVLTHGDGDHTGVAAKLHDEPGIPVHLHPDDVPLVTKPRPKKTDGSILAALTQPRVWRLFAHLARNGALIPVKIPETVPLAAGETVDVPGRPRVIPTPGHTPGHVVLHFPEHGALFVGDAMCTLSVVAGSRGPQLMPRALNVSTPTARNSLAAFEAVDAELVLPGHGEPWTEGAAAAVAQARKAPLT
jgi:glyoxylase-like metal-dependent hydrolase (beta-lactamase superfamily II)